MWNVRIPERSNQKPLFGMTKSISVAFYLGENSDEKFHPKAG